MIQYKPPVHPSPPPRHYTDTLLRSQSTASALLRSQPTTPLLSQCRTRRYSVRQPLIGLLFDRNGEHFDALKFSTGARALCHGTGGAVRVQVSKAAAGGWRAVGRSVGRSVGQVRQQGREREKEIYSYGEIDRRLRGEEKVLSTRPRLYGRSMDARRTLYRARASLRHHHLSIYRNADPPCRTRARPSDGA